MKRLQKNLIKLHACMGYCSCEEAVLYCYLTEIRNYNIYICTMYMHMPVMCHVIVRTSIVM